MKRMKKPLVCKSLAVMLTTIIMAGCSSAPNSESGTFPATAATTTSAVSADTATDAKEESPLGAKEATDQQMKQSKANQAKEGRILLAAAASLKNVFEEELIPMFQEQYPDITVTGTYDSSGKLQVQIEEGLEADVFLSAAVKQMNALNEEGKIDSDTIVNLLENKIVLIVPAGNALGLTSFEEIINADVIALGDPASVPAGQYAEEALTSLGLWDTVQEKANFGTNVTEVLNQVAANSADAGIVYATDAAGMADQVEVVAEAPEDSLSQKVLYPMAVMKESANPDQAKEFVEFLKTPEAMKVFEAYGFAPGN